MLMLRGQQRYGRYETFAYPNCRSGTKKPSANAGATTTTENGWGRVDANGSNRGTGSGSWSSSGGGSWSSSGGRGGGNSSLGGQRSWDLGRGGGESAVVVDGVPE